MYCILGVSLALVTSVKMKNVTICQCVLYFGVGSALGTSVKMMNVTICQCVLYFRREFSISYLGEDEGGQEAYLALLSDWDLDAAFLESAEPYLRLKVDLRPFEEGRLCTLAQQIYNLGYSITFLPLTTSCNAISSFK